MRIELVGRERELAALGGWLEEAMSGRPRVVVSRGEPGIGKTRLSEELVDRAAERGVRSVWGRAVDTEGAPPFWPWRHVVRTLERLTDVHETSGEHGGPFGLDLFSSSTTTGDGPAPEDRFKRFDAVGRLLSDVAAQAALVIILDDLHSADRPSLLLLLHLARTLTDERLLLIANHRGTERQHSEFLTELLREPLARELQLTGLAVPAVRRQLTAVAGRDVGEDEASEVHALTGGNPFFVTELARVLEEARANGSGWRITPSLRDAIGARLQRLPDGTVEVLQAASVVGREFPVALVARMVRRPVAACLAALDEASGAGLVDVGETPAEHRFVHSLVCDAIEAGLATSQRVRLHRTAAEAIEWVYAGQLGDRIFDLARHWAVAAVEGDSTTAAAWIRRAGEEALQRLAFEEAARLFRLALNTGGAQLDNVERCQLLLALGTALHASGDVGARLDACLQAAAVARRLRRADLLAEVPLILEPVLGDVEGTVVARRLCEEARASIDGRDIGLRARLVARFAQACVYLGDIEAAEAASEEALQLAEKSEDANALLAALQARQLARDGPDGVDEREHLSDRLLALSNETQSPTMRMWAFLWRCDVSFERGDLIAAARHLEAAAQVAREVGGRWAPWQLLRYRAVLAQAQARFAEARRLAAEAYRTIAPTRNPFAALPLGALMQSVGHHTGQDREALAANGLTDRTVAERDFPSEAVMFTLAPAFQLVEAGRLSEAATLYHALGPVEGWRPHAHALHFSSAFGILVAIALGFPHDVAALRERLELNRGRHVASGAGAMSYFGPVELWLGVAAAYLGLHDDAVADLEQAVRACAVNGARGFHAEARHELAAVLFKRSRPGDRVRARSLATEVVRDATELGMAPLAEKAHRLIEDAAAGQPDSPLSAREREVAELVAKGMTNRDIARRLFLSERTAQNHVQHILTKLDLSNRSQIAVWMAAQSTAARKLSSEMSSSADVAPGQPGLASPAVGRRKD